MRTTYQQGCAYAGVVYTHLAHSVANHIGRVRRQHQQRPEAGEGIVGWLIVIVAVAAVGLWAVGQFTGEVEARTDCFTLSETAAGGADCPTGP